MEPRKRPPRTGINTWQQGQEPHFWSGNIPSDFEDLLQLPSNGTGNDKLGSYTNSLRLGQVTKSLVVTQNPIKQDDKNKA